MPFIPADIRKAGAKILTFDHVMHRLPIGMALLSLDGIYEAVNDAYCTILGYNKQEELLGKRCSLPFLENKSMQLHALGPDSAHRGSAQHREQQVQCPGINLTHISFKLVSVWGVDGLHRHLVYATDITQHQHTQEKLLQVVAKSHALLKNHYRTHLNQPVRQSFSGKRGGFWTSRGTLVPAVDHTDIGVGKHVTT